MPKAVQVPIIKEFIMNADLKLEIVDLGDAKEATKGSPQGPNPEVHPTLHRRP